MNKILVCCIVVFACTGFVLKSESVATHFLSEVPFNFDFGVPIIKVTIDGNEYDFLFDTGMPTAVSKSISEKLKLKNSRIGSGKDVLGNAHQENFVVVNRTEVGGVGFDDVEALTLDFSSSIELGCLKLDGVIGNNIIKEAVWEIDYERKVIRLTDDIANFEMPENASEIKFKTNAKRGYFSPNIDVVVNNKKRKGVKFDTGSSGGVRLPLAYFSSVIDSTKSVEYYGKATVSVYGDGQNKRFVDSKVKTLEIGDLELQSYHVTFHENAPTVGNLLFKDFKLIINYEDSKMYLIEQKELENEKLENFGFQTRVIDQKAFVSIVYKNSEAEKLGLQLGDEILSLNGIKLTDLISKDVCFYLQNNPLKSNETVDIVYVREGKEYSLQLEKQILLQ